MRPLWNANVGLVKKVSSKPEDEIMDSDTPLDPAILAITKALEVVLAKNDPKARLESSSKDSGELIPLINSVLERFEVSVVRNQQLKDSLKSQIAVRTQELQDRVALLETALREAEVASKSKSIFLANLSHELRTPLNHVIGYSELLGYSAEDDGLEKWVKDLDTIQSSGKEMLAWVEEIIDLATIESGRGEVEIKAFPVSMLLDNLVTSFRMKAEERKIEFEVQQKDPLGEILSDQKRLHRILTHLINNAFKTSENGRVNFEIRREMVGDVEWIEFKIVDTGAGINPRILENLFKEYDDSNPQVSSTFGAEALNLAICNRLTLVMGGHIFAESELGKGSTFTLRLPVDIKSHLAKPHVIRATNRLMDDIFQR